MFQNSLVGLSLLLSSVVAQGNVNRVTVFDGVCPAIASMSPGASPPKQNPERGGKRDEFTIVVYATVATTLETLFVPMVASKSCTLVPPIFNTSGRFSLQHIAALNNSLPASIYSASVVPTGSRSDLIYTTSSTTSRTTAATLTSFLAETIRSSTSLACHSWATPVVPTPVFVARSQIQALLNLIVDFCENMTGPESTQFYDADSYKYTMSYSNWCPQAASKATCQRDLSYLLNTCDAEPYQPKVGGTYVTNCTSSSWQAVVAPSPQLVTSGV